MRPSLFFSLTFSLGSQSRLSSEKVGSMEGDQFARQWRIIQAIEASPDGLTITEIARSAEKPEWGF